MTENLLIPQRMLYQIPGDSMSMQRDKEGKDSRYVHVGRWETHTEKNTERSEKEQSDFRVPGKTNRPSERSGARVWCVPMSLHLTASGRWISVTNFAASRRISMTLLRSANAGASGKEATNRDTNPYWMTAVTNRHHRHVR